MVLFIVWFLLRRIVLSALLLVQRFGLQNDHVHGRIPSTRSPVDRIGKPLSPTFSIFSDIVPDERRFGKFTISLRQDLFSKMALALGISNNPGRIDALSVA